MTIAFYIAAAVAVAATMMVITRSNAIHALLYLVVSLLAVSVVFYVIGAPFVAALEVIIYAGAIMVLLVFAVMLIAPGEDDRRRQREWMHWRAWVGPACLGAILAVEVAFLAFQTPTSGALGHYVGPSEVGHTLYTGYLVGVELASMLLMAGLVAAYHLGHRPSVGGQDTERGGGL